MSAQIDFNDPDVWRLTGELNLVSANQVLSDFDQCCQSCASQQPPKVLDLAGVTRTDSAGLAVLLALRQRTRQQFIEFRHIPAQMLRIAELSGVEDVLTGR